MRSIYITLSCFVLLLLAGFMFNCSQQSEQTKFIQFVDNNHYVWGRSEYKVGHISFSNSGTSLTFGTSTPDVSVLIESMSDPNGSNNNWLAVVVNDVYHSALFLKPGKYLYALDLPASKSNTWTIMLVKATESSIGRVNCYGFQIPAKESCMKFQPMVTSWGREYYGKSTIQFIGNSITCGYGNMASIPAPPDGNPLTGFHAENENAYMSYAMQTARKLNAIPILISYSGKGVYRNFDNSVEETMPKIYDRIHLQEKNSLLWKSDMTQWYNADTEIIVINLGTNDYFGESRNKPLNDAVFVKTYIEFVEKLIFLYPKAKIICANGSMLNDGWPEGKKCWSRIQENLKNVKEHFKAKGNTNIYTFFFTPQSAPYGEDYHPSLVTHTKMAEELTTFIQTVVNK